MTKHLLSTAFLASLAAAAGAQSAGQGLQPISRSAFLERIDGAFVGVDANKDGFLDRGEIETAEAKAFAARKAYGLKQREAAFRKLDTNKDGSLTLQEFNAQAIAAPLPKANAAPILGRLDSNKDGKISLAENRAPTMAQFDRADANKDGTLSVDEQKKPRR